MSERIFIGLGANLGDAAQTLRDAAVAIRQIAGVAWVAQSSLYISAPVDAQGPDFVNAVIEVQSTLEPFNLFKALQGIEQRFGRERSYRNAPRTLDLDLLLYGQRQMAGPELVLPHPRMHLRAFVLHPLAELWPQAVWPMDWERRFEIQNLIEAVADQRIHRATATC
jgi:2-amino-4-hydroxy-6-hydroxymethyldihydropteridine diphosphokinase